jgi:hypothetical protein
VRHHERLNFAEARECVMRRTRAVAAHRWEGER